MLEGKRVPSLSAPPPLGSGAGDARRPHPKPEAAGPRSSNVLRRLVPEVRAPPTAQEAAWPEPQAPGSDAHAPPTPACRPGRPGPSVFRSARHSSFQNLPAPSARAVRHFCPKPVCYEPPLSPSNGRTDTALSTASLRLPAPAGRPPHRRRRGEPGRQAWPAPPGCSCCLWPDAPRWVGGGRKAGAAGGRRAGQLGDLPVSIAGP